MVAVFDKLIELYGTNERFTLPLQLQDESWVDVTFATLELSFIGLSFTGVIASESDDSIRIQGSFAIPSQGSFHLFD